MGAAASRSRKPQSDPALVAEAQRRLVAAPFFARLGALRAALSEPAALIEPSDEARYSAARSRPYNQDFRGYPLLIIQPRSVADVQAAVSFVREHGRGVVFCVACGAHSNRCMLTDSVVLDLHRMNKVVVDAAARTATVEGGAYLGDLDAACEPHGLAVTAGTYPETGVGGLVLAGGYGWLARKHGLSVDNLREVEVVLPDGRAVVANDGNEHADLIWGCRGGGGNFGVVTKFVFELHPIPRKVLGGMKVFLAPTLKSASRVAANFDAGIMQSKDFTADYSGAMLFPAGAPVVVTLWAHTGNEQFARAADVPLFRAADKLGGWLKVQDSVKPISYHKGLQRITQAVTNAGLVYTSLVQIGNLAEPLPPAALDELLRHTKAAPAAEIKAGDSFVLIFPMGGRFAEIDGAKTCLDKTFRSCRYFCILEAQWHARAGDRGRDAARAWVRRAAEILRPYRTAQLKYAPDAISDEAKGVAALADIAAHDSGYAEGTYERLGRVKGKYDPKNFFKQNHNIRPVV